MGGSSMHGQSSRWFVATRNYLKRLETICGIPTLSPLIAALLSLGVIFSHFQPVGYLLTCYSLGGGRRNVLQQESSWLTGQLFSAGDIYGRHNGSLWFVWHGGKYLEGFFFFFAASINLLKAYIFPTRYSKTMIVSYYPLPGLYYSSASLDLFLLLKILLSLFFSFSLFLFFIYAREELLLVDTHNLCLYPAHLDDEAYANQAVEKLRLWTGLNATKKKEERMNESPGPLYRGLSRHFYPCGVRASLSAVRARWNFFFFSSSQDLID